MINKFAELFTLINKGKLYIFVTLLMTVVFLFILFPFSDLSDLVTAQVAKATNNQVFVQFKDLNLGFSPVPGIKISDVYVEGQNLPTLKMDGLFVAPSLSGLIYQKPYGALKMDGFMRGDVSVSIGKGTKSETNTDRQKITIDAEHINLKNLKDLIPLPMTFAGDLSLTSTALADFTLKEQPEVDVQVNIKNFELPPANVETQMGPLTLPEVKLQNVELKGRLVGGKFNLEQATLGKDSDDLHGTVKGGIGLTLQPMGMNVIPLMGAYNFDVDLKVKKAFQDRAALFLTFLDAYKTALPDGARFAFKLNSPSPMAPPSFNPLNK